MGAISVQWSQHQMAFNKLVESLYGDTKFSDCSILGSDGDPIPAHKLILSAASPLLDKMLRTECARTPVLMFPMIESSVLTSIIKYIYKGEVTVNMTEIKIFINTAKSLKIDGNFFFNNENIKLEDVENIEEIDSLPETVQYEEYIEETLLDDDNIEEEGLEDDQDLPVEYLQDESIQGADILEVDEEMVEDRPLTSQKKRLKLTRDLSAEFKGFKADKLPNIKCDDCGGTYKTAFTFNNHLRHDCKQVHECEACGKTYKNRRHLLDHVRDDCGRYHVCTECNREFKQKVNLTTHLKLYCKPKVEAQVVQVT